MTTFAPRTANEVAGAVRSALETGAALEVRAGGSRRALGRPMQTPHVLDVAALSGIVSYEPAELVLTAQPGTPMEAIAAALAEHSQCLAFEPPDLASLLGAGSEARGTLGGAIATGLSGPRRVKAGGARDHVLGIAAVSGRAERFVGGGKVVKNVTGYDLPKLMTGSHGTLAVLTEITLKVLPAPEDVRTLLVGGLTAREAVAAMTKVLQSPVDVSGACHIPAGLALPGKATAAPATALRLEGFRPSVAFRLSRLHQQLQREASLSVLDRDASVAFWHAVRDVLPFAGLPDTVVWRVSVPPAQGAAVLERIEQVLPGVQAVLDWGGGLIWLLLPGAKQAHDSAVRAAIEHTGGHATLIRAPDPVRAATEVFQPQPAGLAALAKRVKAQFDPACVLNPGRMYAGV